MKKTLLTFTFLFCISSTLFSQISFEKRTEYEVDNDYTENKIYEFGELGVMQFSRKKRCLDDQYEWRYRMFNTDLELDTTTSIHMHRKFRSYKTYAGENRIHTFFIDNKGHFSLISVESSNLEITQIDGLLQRKSNVKRMAVLGKHAILHITNNKDQYILSINWETGNKKLIPIEIDHAWKNRVSISNLQVLESSNEILVYVKALINKKESDIYVLRFNDDGEVEEEFNLTNEIGRNIVEISASKVEDGKYIYTGTYSTTTTDRSEGLFICQAMRDKIDFIEFYNFLDLEDFLTYQSERSQQKIISKRERLEEKDKPYILNYRICSHELIPVDDGYIFLGEAYYRTTRTENNTETTVENGVSKVETTTNYVFDGYQYTHAILSKFDKSGKLVWDEIFEMCPSHKPLTVKELISIVENDKNSIKLVYANGGKITSKSISMDGSVIHEPSNTEIEANYAEDKIRHSYSTIDYWYNDYFIAYGYQRIKNIESSEHVKKSRKVFFLSKIIFE